MTKAEQDAMVAEVTRSVLEDVASMSEQERMYQRAVRRWETKTKKKIIAQLPYIVGVQFPTIIAPGALAVQPVSFPGGADFLVERMLFAAYDNAGASFGLSVSRRQLYLQITDQETQSSLFSDFLPVFIVAGTAAAVQLPGLKEPRIFAGNGSANVQLRNDTGTVTFAAATQLVLVGRKLLWN